MNDTLSKY